MPPTKGASQATGIALGYLLLPEGIDAEAMTAEVVEAFARSARRYGYVVAGMFTDIAGRTDHGFYALLGALRVGRASMVVVTGLDHLTHHWCLDGADERTVTRYLRARILRLDLADSGSADSSSADSSSADSSSADSSSADSSLWGITDEQDRHGRRSRADGRVRAQPSHGPGEGRRHRGP